MAGKGIRAGKAFVELFADDSKLVRGLRNAQKRLKAFGSFTARMGAKLLGGAAALAAPFLLATKSFASFGDELDKIAERTGTSVEMLSKLKFAAEQSGADLATLEKGLAGVARFLLDLKLGTKTATDMLQILGITMDDLKDKTPDERIKLLLKSIAAIKDPSIRAGVAMKVLGRAGRQLLPMAGAFEQLAKEAEELGIVMSKEDAAKAAVLTDEMNKLNRVFLAIKVNIGRALAPLMIDLAKRFTDIVKNAIGWVQANQKLIVTVFKIVVGVGAFGAALTATGLAAIVLASLVGALASAVTAMGVVVGLLGTAFALLATPMGVVGALAVGLAAWFINWGDVMARVTATASEDFDSFKDRAVSAWEGIKDAIGAGDLKLAFKLVALSVEGEWIRITNSMKKMWATFTKFFSDVWANATFNAAKNLTNLGHEMDK